MKNIHILPTEKPSRLYYNGTSYKDPNSTMAMDWFISSAGYKPQNIHITSEEEIKEGDYYITILDNEIFKADSSTIRIMNDANKSSNTTYKNTHFKIILTDNQDLIKDGVQAIDNEFIEWFVKNPSCEEVKVVYEPKNFLDTRQGWEYTIISKIPKEDWLLNNPHCKQIESCSKSLSKKCICPKEEPKQETQGYICPQTKKQCDDECCVSAEDCHIEASFDIISDCEPSKQETLEEFIQRQLSLGKYQDQESAIKYSIELGAKWQQERTCKHIYTLTSEQGHRVIKCSKCNDTQPI